MIEEYGIYIFIALIVAIFAMSFYIAKLYVKIKKSEQKISEYKDLQVKKYTDILESIRIISLGVIQDQCEISEGCIRLRMLLKRYDIIDKDDPKLAMIFHLFEELKDFKYLDARKKLTKQQKFVEDNKRFAIEAEYKDQFIEACKHLLNLTKNVKIS
jgi:hypothetical protein